MEAFKVVGSAILGCGVLAVLLLLGSRSIEAMPDHVVLLYRASDNKYASPPCALLDQVEAPFVRTTREGGKVVDFEPLAGVEVLEVRDVRAKKGRPDDR